MRLHHNIQYDQRGAPRLFKLLQRLFAILRFDHPESLPGQIARYQPPDFRFILSQQNPVLNDTPSPLAAYAGF